MRGGGDGGIGTENMGEQNREAVGWVAFGGAVPTPTDAGTTVLPPTNLPADFARVVAHSHRVPAPWGLPDLGLADEYLTWAARPDYNAGFEQKKPGKRAHGVALKDKIVWFEEIVKGTNKGRTRADQITYSERGNLQGAQFYAVAGKVYELAKSAGRGREIPTEWFLQDIRD